MHRGTEETATGSTWRVVRSTLGIGVLALQVAACDTDGVITLPDPDLITRPTIEDTANLPEVRNGVVFELARAYAGPAQNNASPGIVGLSGLLADELWYASTFESMKDIDARAVTTTNGDLETVFRYIHRARNLAERTAELYASSSSANTADHALVTNVTGYAYLFLAENFCSGVPISETRLTGAIEYGAPQTTDELLNEALERFDQARTIATAAGGSAQAQAELNLARVGRGRALLALGQFTEASTAVADVPANFAYFVTFGNLPAPQNGVWYNINSERRSSVASREGNNGIPFFNRGPTNSTIDPRAPVDSTGFGIGTTAPAIAHYQQTKYDSGGADIPLATGIEAQLIRAEATLNKGQSSGYLTTINALRGTVGLSNLADPGTADARVRQFFQERAFWLWLTAHRLGDLRRLMRHYAYTQAQVFPTGATIFGDSYGTDINLPIPFAESNNPQYTGQCIDRNP